MLRFGDVMSCASEVTHDDDIIHGLLGYTGPIVGYRAANGAMFGAPYEIIVLAFNFMGDADDWNWGV